jgi:hypothetical protein
MAGVPVHGGRSLSRRARRTRILDEKVNNLFGKLLLGTLTSAVRMSWKIYGAQSELALSDIYD